MKEKWYIQIAHRGWHKMHIRWAKTTFNVRFKHKSVVTVITQCNNITVACCWVMFNLPTLAVVWCCVFVSKPVCCVAKHTAHATCYMWTIDKSVSGTSARTVSVVFQTIIWYWQCKSNTSVYWSWLQRPMCWFSFSTLFVVLCLLAMCNLKLPNLWNMRNPDLVHFYSLTTVNISSHHYCTANL